MAGKVHRPWRVLVLPCVGVRAQLKPRRTTSHAGSSDCPARQRCTIWFQTAVPDTLLSFCCFFHQVVHTAPVARSEWPWTGLSAETLHKEASRLLSMLLILRAPRCGINVILCFLAL